MSDHAGSLWLDLNGPAASAISFRRMTMRDSNTIAINNNHATAYEVGTFAAAVQNTLALAKLMGQITFTATGTLALRCKRDGTGTVLKNSQVRAWRV